MQAYEILYGQNEMAIYWATSASDAIAQAQIDGISAYAAHLRLY